MATTYPHGQSKSATPWRPLPNGVRLVVVAWEDAMVDASVQGSRDEALRTVKPCVRYTPGFYVGETDTCVVTAGDFDCRGGEPTFATINQIPKALILNIVDCRPKPPRRKG